MEPAQELTSNPMSFLNTTDVTNATDTNTVDAVNTVDMGSLFDSMLDTILGSSAEEAGTGAETPSNFPSPPSFPFVTGCEVTPLGGPAMTEDLFETDLNKLLHPFSESILNPGGDNFDAWDIESMLTAS